MSDLLAGSNRSERKDDGHGCTTRSSAAAAMEFAGGDGRSRRTAATDRGGRVDSRPRRRNASAWRTGARRMLLLRGRRERGATSRVAVGAGMVEAEGPPPQK